MREVTSFKAQYRLASAGAKTPPRPVVEPLSPVLSPTAAYYGRLPPPNNHNEPARSSRTPNGGHVNAPATANNAWACAHPPLSPRALAYEPPAAAPSHVEPPRRASFASHAVGGRAPKHMFARDPTYAYDERPAKRARSEYTSPPYGQHQSRPATSHIPGYNVELMMDNGTRIYQAATPQQQQTNGNGNGNGGEKMLSDAELLLFFSNVSAHTAQTPPSTAKRWSVSQPSPMELAPQQTRQMNEPGSPYAAKAQVSAHQDEQTQDVPDAKPAPEPVAPPFELPSAASAPQTNTPPEAAVAEDSQTLVQEAVPAEGSKSKKQQGWPKGKARGPRSTPSSSKRKRSTPKPKNASAASASTDQTQSPRSLSTEQTGAMAVDGSASVPQAGQTPQTGSQNRRHSFSSTFLQLPSSAASSTPFRAQSVPLGGTWDAAAPALDLARPIKKPTVEQPDLICAACKSSDSEIKVGDGEQWIGCDGCKEWYHYACAGFSSEREVRDVNKFYCGPCRPKFGETTSRSTDAQRRYNSNLVQRFASPSESTRPLTTPVSTKASSRLLTTTPSITISPLSRMET